MKKNGFSYVSAIMSALIVCIITLSVTHIASLSKENKQRLSAHSILTHSMINITEALQSEVSQGIDISDYSAATKLAIYEGVCGTIQTKKIYSLSNTAVYIVNFDIAYKRSHLDECVVIYGNE